MSTEWHPAWGMLEAFVDQGVEPQGFREHVVRCQRCCNAIAGIAYRRLHPEIDATKAAIDHMTSLRDPA